MRKITILSLILALAAITLGAGCVKKTAPTEPDETPKPQEESAPADNGQNNEEKTDAPTVGVETETETETKIKTSSDVSQEELNNLKSEIEGMQFDDLKAL